MGLETGSLRFANKSNKPRNVFSTAVSFMALTSTLFLAGCVLWSDNIATALGYGGYHMSIIYLGGILAIDSFTAILFARLRFEYQAVKFTIFKSIKIGSELGFNLLLFFAAPSYLSTHPDSCLLYFISSTPDFSYILFSIFLSCAVALLLFIPTLCKSEFTFDKKLWRNMMAYSIPLMIAGLPGIANDFIDRILFRYFTPGNEIWQEQLGIFQAGVKISVLMTLFIQMFRYAAEPYFFAGEKNKQAPVHFALIMNYFTAFCMLIFLVVVFYIDAIGLLLGKDFRAGLQIVPVMLGAYALLGINFNLSMWYKLSGKTRYAVYITTVGLVVTLLVNVIFMPIYGYYAAAWGHFLSYATMALCSALLGAKYYPIPYDWPRLWAYLSIAFILYLFSTWLDIQVLWMKFTVNTLLLLVYMAFWFRYEKMNLKKMNIIKRKTP
jgi:O-antigen/teichoic acid export membrane protein